MKDAAKSQKSTVKSPRSKVKGQRIGPRLYLAHLHIKLALPVPRKPDRSGSKVQVHAEQSDSPGDITRHQIRHHLHRHMAIEAVMGR